MDPKLFQELTGQPEPVQQPQQQAQPNSAPQADIEVPAVEIDPDHAKQLFGSMVDNLSDGTEDAAPQAPPPPPATPQATLTPEQIDAQRHSGLLGRVVEATEPPAAVKAFATGGLNALYQTKDFLFGETPPDEQSATRRYLEHENQQAVEQSPIIGGLSSGIGQFAVAMIGLGKLGSVAKALPYVGDALAAGQAAVEGLKGGTAVVESSKAALAGAVAFDPHQERLSNLIQDTPLANPVSEWLAAKPGDSAAWGRVQNAMESIGFDAAIIGALKMGTTVFKYLSAGDRAGANRAIRTFRDEQAAHAAEQEAQQASDPGAITYKRVDGPEAGLQGVPQADRAASGQPDANPAGPSVPTHEGPEAPNLGSPDGGAGDGSKVDTPATVSDAASPQEAGTQLSDGAAAANADDIPVEQVVNPTAANSSAAADTGTEVTQKPADPIPFKPSVEFSADDVSGSKAATTGIGPTTKPGLMDELNFSLENAEKDWNTLGKAGSWDNVFSTGRTLSPDLGVFYSRFKTDTDVIHMIDLGVARKAEELKAQGFRVRQSDAELKAQVAEFSKMANTDPASLMGMLETAGEESRTLTAKMIVLGSLAGKAFHDASTMALRLRLGDWSEYGSREAMEEEIAKRMSMATTMFKLTNDIRAQGGRTLRANRGKPFDPSKFEGLSKERFYALLEASGGDPSKMKYLADPGLYAKIMDTANYLRINSLISGYATQATNLLTNTYMVGARPLERILGSIPGAVVGNDASRSLIKQNLRQYVYTGTALWDGFKSGTKAFLQNESILRPHTSENYVGARWNVPGSQALNGQYFKPWDSLPNVIYNSLSVPLTAVGVPSRVLGGVDEFMKTITYRSKLMAAAHIDAVEQASEAGLRGDAADAFVKNYVQEQLNAGFDAEGRGLNKAALDEASIATFQQDLLPGTLGKGVQTLLASDKSKLTRLILPFVKTPTNVLRYGWKMTPGLNLLQGEYRAMLNGSMGAEARSQALGQMTLGALFMGAAAFIGQDRVTGGGPTDPRVKSQLLATGWRPYSIVTRNEDGTTTYVPFNRMDPVAMPFGIIADIQDAIHIMGDDYETTPEVMQAMGALSMSLAKQFTSRTYLLSLNQALEALSQPDRFGPNFTGSMAASFVPFSAATRQLSTDPYMRDARSIADRMVQAIPGMSQSLPPKYDWLGQKVVNRQGLWTDDNGTTVDHEVQRLSLLPEGSVISAPSPIVQGGAWKVDLRDLTLTTGENAYAKYQELAGKLTPNAKSLRDQIANRINSEAYQNAPDGSVGMRGSKLWLLDQIVDGHRKAAIGRIRADANVRAAILAAQHKVHDRFAHLKQPVPPEQSAGIQAIIKGFGAGN